MNVLLTPREEMDGRIVRTTPDQSNYYPTRKGEKIMKRLIVALVVVVAWSLAALITTRAEGPARKVLKPCVAITGADSHVTKCRYERITSADQWARVWQEHKGKKPTGQYDSFYDPLTLPVIDFDRYMVIAIFWGECWNRTGLTASMTEEDRRIVFGFRVKTYQTWPGGGEPKVAAYGFFVVPRSAKPVVVQEDIGQETFEWKERITFPKL